MTIETVIKKIDRMSDKIVEEALRIVSEENLENKLSDSNKVPWCSHNCVSCLVAEARSNVEEEFDLDFAKGDVAMLRAKYILLEKLKDWEDN